MVIILSNQDEFAINIALSVHSLIFSIISEEMGYFGSVLVIILFAIILIRGLILVMNSKDSYGFYVGSGIIMMIFL